MSHRRSKVTFRSLEISTDSRTVEFTHRWTIDEFEAKTRTFKVSLILFISDTDSPPQTKVGEKIISNEFYLGGQCASLKVRESLKNGHFIVNLTIKYPSLLL